MVVAGAARLALSSLPASTLEALAAIIARTEARVHARANPLVEDLLEDDPAAELERALQRTLTTLTASVALAGPGERANDGLAVQVGASCREAPPDRACAPLWTRGGDAQVARMRFIAWPYAHAVVLRVDLAHAAVLAAALRERVAAATGRIGAVVDASGDHGEGAVRAAARKLRDRLARAGRGPNDDSLLAMLSSDDDARGEVRRRVGLSTDEILVVPRLGALAELAAFEREIAEVIAAQPFAVHFGRRASPSN